MSHPLKAFCIGAGGALLFVLWAAITVGIPLAIFDWAVIHGGKLISFIWFGCTLIWWGGTAGATASAFHHFGIDLTPARPVYPPPPSFPDR